MQSISSQSTVIGYKVKSAFPTNQEPKYCKECNDNTLRKTEPIFASNSLEGNQTNNMYCCECGQKIQAKQSSFSIKTNENRTK